MNTLFAYKLQMYESVREILDPAKRIDQVIKFIRSSYHLTGRMRTVCKQQIML